MAFKKIVLQSIDSPRRDLEWRVFMALKFSRAGISSVIGNAVQIKTIHEKSENCIFFGRLGGASGRTDFDKNIIEYCKINSTSLFFLHDEGAFYLQGEYSDAVKRCYPEDYFKLPELHRVLFWGENQRKVYENHPEKLKFRVTGSPRFDLCRASYKDLDKETVKDLRSKYGDFILMAGRFGAANMVPDEPSSLGKRRFDIRVEAGALDELTRGEILAPLFNDWEKTTIEFAKFVSATVKLANEFPNLNFVFRPHPAERSSFYKDAFSHFDNIFIDKSYDVRPFIHASKALIHCECTTGIEAEISAVPNINYRPCLNMSDVEGAVVAGVSDVGIIVEDYESLLDNIKMLIETEFKFIKSTFDISDYLLNSADGKESSDLIVDEIKEFCQVNTLESKISTRKGISQISLRKIKEYIKSKLKRLWIIFVFNKHIKSGDSKMVFYSKKKIRKIWKELGGRPECIKIKAGIIYTYPEN